MKGKKVLDFLILKPAFTSRNLTSLGLVGIFFLVYILAGGRITVPDVKQGANFGSVSQEPGVASMPPSSPMVNSAAVVERAAPEAKTVTSQPVRHVPVLTDELRNDQASKLSEIEERLKDLKRKDAEN